MFSAITGCLLVFFATMGVVANFNLPKYIKISFIPIPLDAIICIVFMVAVYVSIRVIRSDAKVELLIEIIEKKGKEENDR